MKTASFLRLAVVIFIWSHLLLAQSNEYIVGTYLGNQQLEDGSYTNNIHCSSGSDYTCNGSAGFNTFRAYHIQTESGVWNLVTVRDAGDVSARTVLGQTPVHFKSAKPNILDGLKPGDKVAFRVKQDHRIGAKKEIDYWAFVPKADDPSKDDKFEASFVSNAPPRAVQPKPTDNIAAMCAAHRFSAEQEKQICSSIGKAPATYRAGIRFLQGANHLQVLVVEPGSPNQSLLQQFIVAVEGERGSGAELQSKLGLAIAHHQDGAPVKLIVSPGPGGTEQEADLKLFAPN